MKSSVVKRSTIVAGHKTSVSLEDAFWNDLRKIATEHEMTLSDLVSKINSDRQQGNLSSAIRLFVLEKCRCLNEHSSVRRMFVRQTIDLGGESQKVDAGINQFAGSQTAARPRKCGSRVPNGYCCGGGAFWIRAFAVR